LSLPQEEEEEQQQQPPPPPPLSMANKNIIFIDFRFFLNCFLGNREVKRSHQATPHFLSLDPVLSNRCSHYPLLTESCGSENNTPS
jgi:hypothetical protein